MKQNQRLLQLQQTLMDIKETKIIISILYSIHHKLIENCVCYSIRNGKNQRMK